MSSTIAQIPVYQFQNEQGLTKVGDSLYQQSDNSGTAFFDKDSKGNYSSGGTIMSNALEMSNVSLASAMTQLLITQKAFDASAKCVTTSDQMIQKAIAMPR
jgi:flagellar hook protein FlgE